MTLPTPHGDKLSALLKNKKLPPQDHALIKKTIKKYRIWKKMLAGIPPGADSLAEAVKSLNEYRLFLDLEVIFDSADDFLYRQKGQLKLDNTVLEEFLPALVAQAFPDLSRAFSMDPQSCFAALYFTSNLLPSTAPGARVKTKNQDFTISKRLFVTASFDPEHGSGAEQLEANLGYLCAECKTNLDKTMFQEACATAHDLKTAVPGAKYFLICEWLDMTPISTSGTDIDEVLVLRKAKRLGSQIRSAFAARAGRAYGREDYHRHLAKHPLSAEVFQRFLTHVRTLLENRDPSERDVLEQGYF